ncbi:MAG TPA: FG-GAP-like repeat-containing protein [Acidobacteriaceae bacterium]|nr:FG-GAP-like repeat-containing protein [Acidobacteriaceae bacterium]
MLKGMGLAPLLLRPAPLAGFRRLWTLGALPEWATDSAFGEVRLRPHYPQESPLDSVLRLVEPGLDGYLTEKFAAEIEAALRQWGQALRASGDARSVLAGLVDAEIKAPDFVVRKQRTLRSAFGVTVVKRKFAEPRALGRDAFLDHVAQWMGEVRRVDTAEFEVYGIEQTAESPITVRTDIRYDIVGLRADGQREERVGSWEIEWRSEARGWMAQRWLAREETVSVMQQPAFVDVTAQALGETESWKAQMLFGADYWRTVLDGAVALDVYGNNGVAAGDFDGDGLDDLYVCQPAGLPNRLYRNRGDGTFEDVTARAGVGVLDNTACALFVDFDNRGLQDLLLVCGTGPLLFVNRGDGTFALKRDAFRFARAAEGTFTHAAAADYDGDGRLDLYLCTYQYYLGLDQYHYPVPYYDARNGPPNCLFHNEGGHLFVEATEKAGLSAQNNRYSFACAWGQAGASGKPDLFIANDFGSSQLYRNNGDGTFTDVSVAAKVEEVGAGMSCCWQDFDNDGQQDIYVPSMWEAAGQRVAGQKQFHAEAPENIRALYRRHARGNALYRNQGDGTFANVGETAGVEMGRWSWSSDFWDFDHDGFPDLYVANGYISGKDRNDLASFFWRQVVAQSPDDATASTGYERAWNAINELIRSDQTWHGYARNVMFANNGDGTFAEISGPAGLDFPQDCRSFALADLDHDGRLEIVLKSRNAPQIRILRNAMRQIGDAISIRLRGTKGNRDAIGAAVTLECGSLRQTRFLQAGSGFLAQHAKELFFGLGATQGDARATIRWPSGQEQVFEALPRNHRVEIEEGAATFSARLFAAPPVEWNGASHYAVPEQLPAQTETWLIEPLQAPSFSLPDIGGKMRTLDSFRGKPLLMMCWSSDSPLSTQELDHLQRNAANLPASGIELLGMNLDGSDSAQKGRERAKTLAFPQVFATDEVAGIYNLVYRHLFDRHRDLPLPTSFLIDSEGKIVMVLNGPVDPLAVSRHAASIPVTDEERRRKALPFPGVLVQDSFERNAFTFGVAMVQHGYLEQAAKNFEQVIAARPDDADAWYNLGTLSLRRNDPAQARKYLETTLKLRPGYPEAWNNLGMVAAQQGANGEAIADFQRAIELRPNYAVAMLNLGNVFRREHAWDRAEHYLNQALALQRDDAETNFSLGMLYAQQQEQDRAEQYLRRAVEIRPNYAEALNNLGVLLAREQKLAEAENEFKAAVKAAPEFDQSYLNLARLYVVQNETARAREILYALLRLQPENSAARQAIQMLQSAP